MRVYKTPTRDQIKTLLRDPAGGGAVALLQDGRGDWFAWRRENAPPHLVMSHTLEATHGALFPAGRPLNRHTAESVDEAMTIMRDRSAFGPAP